MEEERSNNNRSSSSSSSNGGLDTGKSERSVWLMKCPLVVAKSWQSHSAAASSDSPPLSKVVVSVDALRPEDSSSLQLVIARTFTMEMASNEIGNMPKTYSLNMFKDFVPMCVFSETNQGNVNLVGKVAMEGKVEHKFDMKPHNENLEEYSKMCRERTNKSMIKNRQILVIDNDRGVHMRPMPGMVGLVASSSKKRKFSEQQRGNLACPNRDYDMQAFGQYRLKIIALMRSSLASDKKKTAPIKAPEVKRTRRDRGELEEIMFKLFERQPNWALKQLVQETAQPAQFLKEILNELCVYNKRGTNQGTYELKPEYKKSVEDTEIPIRSSQMNHWAMNQLELELYLEIVAYGTPVLGPFFMHSAC
ncbi:unnamed protein product [Camellia sinensis]